MIKKRKRFIAAICSVLILISVIIGVSSAFASDSPILSYTFEEDCEAAPALFGNAASVYNSAKGSKVLRLDGTEGTYAQIPTGVFDGMETLTISFDVLANSNSGNYFTFAIGKNNEVYDFFRIRDNEIRNAITLYSYPNEQETRYVTSAGTDNWMHVGIVIDETHFLLYVNGTLASENANTGIKLSDMGTDLISYFGKSFYDGDAYFNGCFDNFEVYDRAMGEEEIRGIANQHLSESASIYYSFESDCNFAPDYYGNAAVTYDADKKSNVLYLDGTDGTYAQLPTGFFDGKDTLSILMDVKPAGSGGNFFTFAFGQNSTKYDFLRIRGTEVRNAITVNSYWSEQETKSSLDYSNSWMHIAIIIDGTSQKLYVNGALVSENQNTGISVSDLGSNLLAYIGKSLYDGDAYFKGYFDNVEVYESVLSNETIRSKAVANLPLLLDVTVGSLAEEFESISGTDSHTCVKTELNRSSAEITSIIQQRQDTTRTLLSLYLLSDDCRVYVDGIEKSANCYIDLSADRELKIVCGDVVEEYTLKTPQIASNPVLPGQYADPDIDVLDGKFWIFPTTDGVIGWGGTQFHAFSSPDLVNWTDEGVILDLSNKSPSVNEKGIQTAASVWSGGNAWAPAIEGKNGKYYFYYCGRILDEYTSLYGEGMAIGVAYADSPQGPYTASASPILYPKMMSDANIGFYGQVIDPSVFTDSDGTSYLLFGNGMAAMATLGSDMISVNTSSLRIISGLTDFRESIAVFKRNNNYYFTWSCDDTGSENYHINYGIASSLTGSITNKGTLLQKDTSTGILATGHQSVIYLQNSDRCFIAYHRFYTPISQSGCVGHHRETCIDEITFKKKLLSADELNPVTPSYSGPGAVDVNGHSINETVIYPTCTQDGSISGTCANGETSFVITAQQDSRLSATGHKYKTKTHQPTCTEQGFDEHVCEYCGESYIDNYTPANGHNLSVSRVGQPSRFLFTCSDCDLSRELDLSELVNSGISNEDYEALLDANGDGYVNIRDYSILLGREE